MPGMTFRKKRMKLTMRPAHVREEDNTVETVVVTDAVAEGSNPLGGSMVFMEFAASEEAEEMVEVRDVVTDVAKSVKFVERLNAIVVYKSRCYSDHILACGRSTNPEGRLGEIVLQSSWKSMNKPKLCAELPGAKNIPPRK
jgi:hypothetical protein